MNLYTILMDFEDRRVGIGQIEATNPEDAFLAFIRTSESLEDYNRDKILAVLNDRIKQKKLLIHIADNLKGFWIIDFGMDFFDDSELSSIYGGHVIQTDPDGPLRNS